MATFDRLPDPGPTALTAPRRGLTTPRAAGVAGIVFAVLFVLALVLLRQAVGQDLDNETVLLNLTSDGSASNLALVGLYTVPFSGITFLWFVGFARSVGYSFLFVYASKAAGVFTLVTSTIIRRSGWSRWTFLSGYATPVLLILSISFFEPIVLIFAAWVAVVSLYLLVTGGEGSRAV
jgi:hypothetical protein